MSKFQNCLREFSAWFERQKRVLPWREEPTLYRVWISEIMLQQTQVVTVIPYFERFIARFPSVEVLAQASEDDVMTHWAGLGYYSRARNLHRAAKQIVILGDFPRHRDGWLEIPGVGPYTAGAITSIALDLPEAILDGNVERVLSRVRRVGASDRGQEWTATDIKNELWKVSKRFLAVAFADGIRPSVFNQALMELGATVCTPKSPRCCGCPLRPICKAQVAGEAEKFPLKKKKKQWIAVSEAAHCLMDDDGRVLLEKGAAGQWRSGLWDLPRELSSEMSKKYKKMGKVETRHIVTRHKITRETTVYQRAGQARLSVAESRTELRPLKADENSVERRWEFLVDLLGEEGERPKIAVGSALKRTLTRVLERFPEAVPERSGPAVE